MTLPDIPDHYTIPVARPDWPLLLTDWRPLLPEGSAPWLVTKFGELVVSQQDGKIGMLQVSGFRYQVVANDKTDFQEWLVDPEKMAEWFLAPLVDQLETSGRLLGPDQCYSFIQAPSLGGSFAPDNVAVLSVRDHFCGWAKVFRQVGGLAPGTQIIAKQP